MTVEDGEIVYTENSRQSGSIIRMNHKRKRPKNARSGCKLCKPHKINGVVKTYHIRGIKWMTGRNPLKQLASD